MISTVLLTMEMIKFKYENYDVDKYDVKEPKVLMMCERFHKFIFNSNKKVGEGSFSPYFNRMKWTRITVNGIRSIIWRGEYGDSEISYKRTAEYTEKRINGRKIQFNHNDTLRYYSDGNGTEKYWNNGVLTKTIDSEFEHEYYPSGFYKTSYRKDNKRKHFFDEDGLMYKIVVEKDSLAVWPGWIEKLQGVEKINSKMEEIENKDFKEKIYEVEMEDMETIKRFTKITVHYHSHTKIYQNGQVEIGKMKMDQQFGEWKIYDLEGNVTGVKYYDTIKHSDYTEKYYWEFGVVSRIEYTDLDDKLYKIDYYFRGEIDRIAELVKGKWEITQLESNHIIYLYAKEVDNIMYQYQLNGVVMSTKILKLEEV